MAKIHEGRDGAQLTKMEENNCGAVVEVHLFQKVVDESQCEGVAKENQLPTKEEVQKLIRKSADYGEKNPEHERLEN